MFKKIGKVLLLTTILLALAVTALNYLGVFLDEEPLDYSGLIPIQEVASENNGFDVLGDFLVDDDREFSDQLDKLVNEKFDPQGAKLFLEKHDQKLELVSQVLAKPAFKSHPVDFDAFFPDYTKFGDLINLLLLKSKLEAKNQRHSESILQIEQAINFSQKVKTDQSGMALS